MGNLRKAHNELLICLLLRFYSRRKHICIVIFELCRGRWLTFFGGGGAATTAASILTDSSNPTHSLWRTVRTGRASESLGNTLLLHFLRFPLFLTTCAAIAGDSPLKPALTLVSSSIPLLLKASSTWSCNSFFLLSLATSYSVNAGGYTSCREGFESALPRELCLEGTAMVW
jgi:hypothetical protein